MIASIFIDGGDPTTWMDDAYWTGGVVVGTVVALAVLGYLIFARSPESEVPVLGLGFGAIGALAWPLVITAGVFAGLIFGIRALVHGDLTAGVRRRMARGERREELIRNLEAENARLEAELGIGAE